MNAVTITYTIAREGVAGEVSLSILRSGNGDDMIEQFADNIELAIRRPAQAAGYELPEAERTEEPI